MTRSAQWHNGRFHNLLPLRSSVTGMVASIFSAPSHAYPQAPLPVLQPEPEQLGRPSAEGLRAVWLGHSTLLLDIDGTRILTDPVWGDRASPFSWAGPKRFFAPLLPLDALPRPDAVVISHDHYDHLDRETIMRMKDWDTRFITPLGVGARLVGWGIPLERITELDWWETTRVASLEIACTPARHASGRGLFDRNKTLWAGFAFLGERHRVYFSGDTGYTPALADIGLRYGPFDLTFIEAGAYNQAWPDWHLGPEQAVQAHRLVRGRLMVPIHWGMFKLAPHGWTEPAERVLAAAQATGVAVVIPRPGETVVPSALPPQRRWWPDLPWQTHQETPIVSSLHLEPAAQNDNG